MLKFGRTKARKQRNAVAITLGSKFNIPAGKEFYVLQEEDDCIHLVPRTDDFFIEIQKIGIEDTYDEFDEKFIP